MNEVYRQKYLKKLRSKMDELRDIVSPDATIARHTAMSLALDLLTGKPNEPENVDQSDINWHRKKEIRALKKLEQFVVDKGCDRTSKKLTKMVVLQKIIDYLEAQQNPPTPAPAPLVSNRRFFIENLLKKDTAPIPPPTHLPPTDFDANDENDEEIDVVG